MSGYNLGTAWLQVSLSGQGIGKELRSQIDGLDSHIGAATKGWGSSISGSLGGAFKSAVAVGGAVLAGATAYVASYASAALKASDSAQKFASTLEFAGLDDSKIQSLTESTKKYAAQTVYDISDIRNTTAALAANGVQGYEQLAQAAGNLNAVAGGSSETFKTVGSVMTQTAGAGKLVTENWNQLRDAVPGASKRIKDALAEAGAFTGDFNEAMSKGEITAEEFNDAIMKLGFEDAAIKAASSTATFEGAWGNFQATITDGVADLIDIFKGDLTGGISIAADTLQSFFTKTKDLLTGIRSIVKDGDFTGFGSLGIDEDHPLVDFLFSIRENIESVKKSFAPLAGLALGSLGPLLTSLPVVGSAFAGITGPVGLVIGLFAQMYANSETLRTGLSLVFQAIISSFTGVGSSLGPALAGIFSGVGQVATVLGDVLGTVLINLAPLLGTVASIIGETLVAAVNSLLPVVASFVDGFDSVSDVISAGFATVLPVLLPALQQLGSAFVSLAESLGPVVQQVGEALMPVFEALWPVIQGVFGTLASVVAAVLPVLTQAVAAVGTVLGTLGTLVGFVSTILTPVIQALAPVVLTVFENIKSLISSAAQYIQGIIKTFTSIISGDWKGAWEGMKQTSQGLLNIISSIISGMLNVVISIVTSAMSALSALWSASWNALYTGVHVILNSIISSVSGKINLMVGLVRGIPGMVQRIFSGASSWLYSAGSSLIQGFIDGICSAFNSVRSTLSELTALLPDWKGPIDVDRVILRDAGKLVIGGFVDGMESKYGDAHKSLRAFTNDLGSLDSLGTDFTPPHKEDSPSGGREITVNQYISVANVPSDSDMASMAAEQARLIGATI